VRGQLYFPAALPPWIGGWMRTSAAVDLWAETVSHVEKYSRPFSQWPSTDTDWAITVCGQYSKWQNSEKCAAGGGCLSLDIGSLIKIQNLTFWIMNPLSLRYKMEAVISGNCCLLRNYASRSGIVLPKFRANIISISKLKMGQTFWTETSVRNYHYLLCNYPEERSCHGDGVLLCITMKRNNINNIY